MSDNKSTHKEKYALGFHPFLFFFGYDVLKCDEADLPLLIDLCRRLRINYRTVREKKGPGVALCVPFFSSSKLLSIARIPSLIRVKRCGLPAVLLKNRTRIGIPAGVIAVIIAIFLSANVIWDIRIDGNDRVSDDEIISILDECGLSVGCSKIGLSTIRIENAALILSDDIAWISVNIIGCIAEVNVKEIDFPTEDIPESDASNVISDANGIIVGFEDIRGNICVSIGDEVSRGQLLISGIYGDGENGFRYTNAKGRVLAEVERTFFESIERVFSKKKYTGEQKCEKYLIFFKKEIKIFGNCGNLYENYDKIEVVEYLPALSGECLPIGIRTVTYSEYVYEDVERTDEELLSVAKYRQNASISLALRDAELLSKKESYNIDDSGITLTCKLRSIENIAKAQEIEIANLSSKK